MNSTSNLILAVALIVIMTGMGLGLEIRNFKDLFTRPKAIFLGLFNQILLLPLMGFLLARGLNLSSDLAVGLMILAACPGGATSNLVAHLARADVALSVSLTALSSLVTILSIPFVVNFALVYFGSEANIIQLDLLETIGKIFVTIVFPVSLGMFIKSRKPGLALKLEKPVRKASTAFLILIIIGIIVQERARFMDYLRMAGMASLLLNLSTVGLGFVTARLVKLRPRQALSIAIETGIQNGTMAMMIASVMLQHTAYAIAPAVYSLLMFGTGFFIVMYGIRRHQTWPVINQSY